MKRIALILLCLTVLTAVAQKNKEGKKKKIKLSKMDKEWLAKQPDGLYARLNTNRGDIYLVFEMEKTPMTVANFVGLAEGKIKNTAKPEGVPYYDSLIFHRIIPNFMIQGGCPKGNGSGDPGYKFPDEFVPDSAFAKKGYVRGTLAMANAGPNTNGSQFFIMHKDYGLPYNYTIFGHVVEGIEVVDSIVNTPRERNDRPLQDQRINKVVILRKGKAAESFDAAKVFEEQKVLIVKKAEEQKKAEMEAQDKMLKETYANATVTASGLRYIVEKEGTGAAPTRTSNVTVHYTGYLMSNGKKFDSSHDRGQPITFGLGQVIPGWTEGLQTMKEGGKSKLIIPPNLGYGPQGVPGVIPPNSWLVFDVELIKVN